MGSFYSLAVAIKCSVSTFGSEWLQMAAVHSAETLNMELMHMCVQLAVLHLSLNNPLRSRMLRHFP